MKKDTCKHNTHRHKHKDGKWSPRIRILPTQTILAFFHTQIGSAILFETIGYHKRTQVSGGEDISHKNTIMTALFTKSNGAPMLAQQSLLAHVSLVPPACIGQFLQHALARYYEGNEVSRSSHSYIISGTCQRRASCTMISRESFT